MKARDLGGSSSTAEKAWFIWTAAVILAWGAAYCFAPAWQSFQNLLVKLGWGK